MATTSPCVGPPVHRVVSCRAPRSDYDHEIPWRSPRDARGPAARRGAGPDVRPAVGAERVEEGPRPRRLHEMAQHQRPGDLGRRQLGRLHAAAHQHRAGRCEAGAAPPQARVERGRGGSERHRRHVLARLEVDRVPGRPDRRRSRGAGQSRRRQHAACRRRDTRHGTGRAGGRRARADDARDAPRAGRHGAGGGQPGEAGAPQTPGSAATPVGAAGHGRNGAATPPTPPAAPSSQPRDRRRPVVAGDSELQLQPDVNASLPEAPSAAAGAATGRRRAGR